MATLTANGLGVARITACSTVVLLFAHAIGADAQTRNVDDAKPPRSFAEAMDVLYQWLGPWTAIELHFDADGQVIGEAKGSEEGRWILDERAIRRVYRSSGSGAAFVTEGTFTWNQVDGLFDGFWVDNQSTHGPGRSRARWNAESKTMTYDVEYASAAGEPERFRVVERFVDDKHRKATTYRLRGDDLVKVLEVDYERSGPCPERQSTVRIIYDGIEQR